MRSPLCVRARTETFVEIPLWAEKPFFSSSPALEASASEPLPPRLLL